MQLDYKTARRQLTGNMPTGSYDMSGMEFSVAHTGPVVTPQPETNSMLYFTSFADFERWYDEQQP